MSSRQLAHRALSLLERTSAKAQARSGGSDAQSESVPRSGKVPKRAGGSMKRKSNSDKASAEQRLTAKHLAKLRAHEDDDHTEQNLKVLTRTLSTGTKGLNALMQRKTRRTTRKRSTREEDEEDYAKHSLFAGFENAPLPTLRGLKAQELTQQLLKADKKKKK